MMIVFLLVQLSVPTLAADRKPPSMQVLPKNGESEIPVSSSITVTFSEQVKLISGSAITSKNASTLFDFTRAETGERVEAGVSWSIKKKRVTITPKKPLAYGTTYRLSIPANKVKDHANNGNQQLEITFQTEDLGPPLQVEIEPAHNAQYVSVDTTMKLRFNKTVVRANHQKISDEAVEKIVKLADEKGKKVAFRGKWDEKLRTATIDPVGNLADGVTYTLTLLEKKVMDRQGVKNPETINSFTTRKRIDTIAPTASVQPGHGATGVPIETKIIFSFAEEVTLTDGTPLASKHVQELVQLIDEKGSAVAYRATWNKSKRTLSIQAKGNLSPNTTYTITLPANRVRDLSGNVNKSESIVFSTGRE